MTITHIPDTACARISNGLFDQRSDLFSRSALREDKQRSNPARTLPVRPGHPCLQIRIAASESRRCLTILSRTASTARIIQLDTLCPLRSA